MPNTKTMTEDEKEEGEFMRIDFPEHVVSAWRRRPWWLFWKPMYRRYHWRWTVDHTGCECTYYWQYGWWGERSFTDGQSTQVRE